MKFVAILGCNYKDFRFEPGEEVSGLPDKVIRTLIKSGAVKQVGGPKLITEEEKKGGDES